MPAFTRELEHTLHNALAEASKRHHEYATLEHLLLALVADTHAHAVMKACGADTEEPRAADRVAVAGEHPVGGDVGAFGEVGGDRDLEGVGADRAVALVDPVAVGVASAAHGIDPLSACAAGMKLPVCAMSVSRATWRM